MPLTPVNNHVTGSAPIHQIIFVTGVVPLYLEKNYPVLFPVTCPMGFSDLPGPFPWHTMLRYLSGRA